MSGYIRAIVLMTYNGDGLEGYMHVVPHTACHVVTSLRAMRHFSLQDVLKAGRWSSPITFITH